MKCKLMVVVLSLLLLVNMSAFGKMEAGTIIIEFESGSIKNFPEPSATISQDYFLNKDVYKVLSNYGCTQMIKNFPNFNHKNEYWVSRIDPSVTVSRLWLDNVYHYDFPDGTDIETLAGLLKEESTVLMVALGSNCEPSFERYEFSNPDPLFSNSDPVNPGQWQLSSANPLALDMNMEEAWLYTQGLHPSPTKIAVFDQKVWSGHSDLSSSRLEGLGVTSTPPPNNEYHGTAVASIIGAIKNNGTLIAGIHHQDNIISCNILGTDDISWDLAFDYIFDDQSTVVINNSWRAVNENGIRVFNEYLQRLLMSAQLLGKTVVTSRGNTNFDTPQLPACAGEFIVSVGAYDYTFERTYNSSKGNGLDIMAPTSTLACGTNNIDEIITFYGTSCAAPHVTAVVKMMESYHEQNGNLSVTLWPSDFQGILKATAQYDNTYMSEYEYGKGLIDAFAALQVLDEDKRDILWHQIASGYSNVQAVTGYENTVFISSNYASNHQITNLRKYTKHVNFPVPYDEPPLVWGNRSSGIAITGCWPGYFVDIPWCGIENITTNGFDLFTYGYDLVNSNNNTVFTFDENSIIWTYSISAPIFSTVPSTPGIPSVGSNSDGSVLLTWAGSSGPIEYYSVYRSSLEDGWSDYFTKWEYLGSTTSTNLSDPDFFHLTSGLPATGLFDVNYYVITVSDYGIPSDHSHLQIDLADHQGSSGVVLDKTVPIEPESDLPLTTDLQGVYPNPFNSNTMVHFSLAESSRTILKVYSIEGRLVEKIDLGELTAGYHKHNLTIQVSSGVYILDLEATGRHFTSKILYLQ